METQRRNTSGRAAEIHCFLITSGDMINLFGRFSKEFANRTAQFNRRILVRFAQAGEGFARMSFNIKKIPALARDVRRGPGLGRGSIGVTERLW
jgi:hypothetical protein